MHILLVTIINLFLLFSFNCFGMQQELIKLSDLFSSKTADEYKTDISLFIAQNEDLLAQTKKSIKEIESRGVDPIYVRQTKKEIKSHLLQLRRDKDNAELGYYTVHYNDDTRNESEVPKKVSNNNHLKQQTETKCLMPVENNLAVDIPALRFRLHSDVDNVLAKIHQSEEKNNQLQQENTSLQERLKNSGTLTNALFEKLKKYYVNPLADSSLPTIIGGGLLVGSYLFFAKGDSIPPFPELPFKDNFYKSVKDGCIVSCSILLADLSRKMINVSRLKLKNSVKRKNENILPTFLHNVDEYLEKKRIIEQGQSLAMILGGGIIFKMIASSGLFYPDKYSAELVKKDGYKYVPTLKCAIGVSVCTGIINLSHKAFNYVWDQINNNFYIKEKDGIEPMSLYR